MARSFQGLKSFVALEKLRAMGMDLIDRRKAAATDAAEAVAGYEHVCTTREAQYSQSTMKGSRDCFSHGMGRFHSGNELPTAFMPRLIVMSDSNLSTSRGKSNQELQLGMMRLQSHRAEEVVPFDVKRRAVNDVKRRAVNDVERRAVTWPIMCLCSPGEEELPSEFWVASHGPFSEGTRGEEY